MKKALMAGVVVLASAILVQASVVKLQNNGTINPVTDGTVSATGGSITGSFSDNSLRTEVCAYWSTSSILIKFALPGGLTAGDVQSATLSLYDTSGSGNLYVYQLGAGAAWNTNATYNTRNGTDMWPGYSGYESGQVGCSQLTDTGKVVSAAPGWVNVDVTSIVKSWLGGQTNNGVLVQSFQFSSGSGGYVNGQPANMPLIVFNSSEYAANYAQTPMLTIVPEPVSLVLIGLGAVMLRRKVA